MSLFNLLLKVVNISVVIASLAACASKPMVDTNVTIDFPPDEIVTSVVQADNILKTAALARSQIDWRYRQKEQICYDKFFMNSCLQDAKAELRIDLGRVKKSEVAANFFKRKQQVEDMDRNLVEKNVANPLPNPLFLPNPGPSQKNDGDTESDNSSAAQSK